MKKSTIAASTILAILVLGTAAVTFAHGGISLGSGSNSSQSTNSSTTVTLSHPGDDNNNESSQANQNNQGNQSGQGEQDNGLKFNLTVGTTLTFSNLTGHWVAFTHVGNQSGHGDDGQDPPMMMQRAGNSSGSFTFKVTSNSDHQFNLTITSGSFTINGTKYTVSSGSLSLNAGGESGFGTGNASGGATFEIRVAGIHGNTTSAAQVGAIRLDVQVGKSSYLVILGSQAGVGENSDDNESD